MTPIIFLKIHSRVLFASLAIEKNSSHLLSQLLGINNAATSRTLGNKSSSLSLNTKIDLLIDIGALDKETKKVFQSFMEVRNQLMHNIDAGETYEKCFSFLEGTETYLNKRYNPDKTFPREEQLEFVVDKLSEEVIVQTDSIIEKVKAKLTKDLIKEGQTEIYKRSHEAYVVSIRKVSDDVEKMIHKLLDQGSVFDEYRLRGFVGEIITTLHSHWQSGFEIENKP